MAWVATLAKVTEREQDVQTLIDGFGEALPNEDLVAIVRDVAERSGMDVRDVAAAAGLKLRRT